MSGLVLDCSATLAWVFEDEKSLTSTRLLARVDAEGAVVPAIWAIEVANILVLAERKGRIAAGGALQRLDILREIAIAVDDSKQDRLWTATVELAAAERLTVYDASYLELAIRRALPLASKDRDLVAAAQRRGVDVIPILDA